MMIRSTLAALGLALPLAACALPLGAFAHEFTAGALVIGHPYAVETAPGVRTGAGYFSVENTGTEPDRLLAVKADFPKVEVHATTTDAAGVARMAPVEAVEIPTGATIELAPKGMHVMFMGLAAPLAAGTEFPAALVFEKAGEVPVVFKVEPRAPGAAPMGQMDHSGHMAPTN